MDTYVFLKGITGNSLSLEQILYFYGVMLKDLTIFNLGLYYFLTLKKTQHSTVHYQIMSSQLQMHLSIYTLLNNLTPSSISPLKRARHHAFSVKGIGKVTTGRKRLCCQRLELVWRHLLEPAPAMAQNTIYPSVILQPQPADNLSTALSTKAWAPRWPTSFKGLLLKPGLLTTHIIKCWWLAFERVGYSSPSDSKPLQPAQISQLLCYPMADPHWYGLNFVPPLPKF